MQQIATTPAVPVQTGVVTTPQLQQTQMLNIPIIGRFPVIRVLGITQIVFGAICFILTIVSKVTLSQSLWANVVECGIWFGIWMVITGIIGVCSSYKPQVGILNGVNMGVNIACTVVSFLVGILFAFTLGHYNTCKEIDGYYIIIFNPLCHPKQTGIAVYAILLVLMIAEFCVSLTISIYCCRVTRCCATRFFTTRPISGQMISNTGHPTQTGYPARQNIPTYPPGTSYQASMYQQDQRFYQGTTIGSPIGANTKSNTYSGDLATEYQNTADLSYPTAS